MDADLEPETANCELTTDHQPQAPSRLRRCPIRLIILSLATNRFLAADEHA